jgi:hypothetical protein
MLQRRGVKSSIQWWILRHESMSLSAADLRPIESLRQAAGDKFVRGIIFYGGTQSLPFGPNCWAFPIDALWSRFAPRA